MITPGQMSEFWRQVKIEEIDRDYFQDFLNHRLTVDNLFLRRISNEPLIIDAVDGLEILADATDMFAGIDSDFENWGADEPGQETGEVGAVVYEITKDGTFAQLFGSLSGDVQKLCFTQAQIKRFVKKYRSWLRVDGYGTFFLFQSKGEFFVASVHVRSGGSLSVRVDRFDFTCVWRAGHRRRVVVPQLA
ncbi:hypothetical protein KKH38_01655 [Patescibacteria group bacterium]|nr:hypothetical protein [Patescibacteria group bacterium]MBU4600922.1 hypothetical protein [Patescibacteria group bacterium]MCG2697624.1 hypothetical protein [Candidatus Parcubacteria bacterium]